MLQNNMTDSIRLRGMIGLAAKAGKLKSGEFSSEESIKKGRARVCLISSEASERTGKHFHDMCSYRSIPIYTVEAGKEELGQMIGRGPRSMVTIEDRGFAENIVRLVDGGSAGGNRE